MKPIPTTSTTAMGTRAMKIVGGISVVLIVVAIQTYLFDHKADNDPAPWFGLGLALGPVFWMLVKGAISASLGSERK